MEQRKDGLLVDPLALVAAFQALTVACTLLKRYDFEESMETPFTNEEMQAGHELALYFWFKARGEAAQPMGGDIAKALCAIIAERLEGLDMDAQIAFYARAKAALLEETEPAPLKAD